MPNLFVKYNTNMNSSNISNILANATTISSASEQNSEFTLVSYNDTKYIVQQNAISQNVYYANDLYTVSLKSKEDNEQIVQSLVSNGYSAYLPFPDTCHYIIHVDILSINSVDGIITTLNALNQQSSDLIFSLNGMAEANLIPNDSLFSSQWYLNLVNAPTAWDITTGSNNITVAVLDTGVCGSNLSTGLDIRPKLVTGTSFIVGEPDTFDAYGHGTQCSHIIGAITNNSSSMAGVSWLCKIAPVKVLNSSGNGGWSGIAAGILWAADNNCDVLSLSLGGSPNTQTDAGVVSAIDYAIGRGCVVVLAAGNSGPSLGNNPPANCSPVISVGAVTSTQQTASFSSFQNGSLSGRSNNRLTLCAPGASILSINHLDAVANVNGTSFACPIVAGCCALIKSINRNLDHTAIKTILEQSTGNSTWDQYKGYGLLNMRRALELVQPAAPSATPTPTLTPTSTLTPTPITTATPTPTPTRISSNPRNSSAIIACIPNNLLRANPSANKICFRVGGGGASCCNVDGFPIYSNEICVNIPPPPPPPPSPPPPGVTPTPGPAPCIPSLSNGPFTMDIVYEASMTSGSIPCNQGSHICNNTLFDVMINSMKVGTANLNNAQDGGSRSSRINIPNSIISGSSFSFELRCQTNNCHNGVAIVRVFDSLGNRIYQSCLQNGVVLLISECPPVTPPASPGPTPCG